MAQNASPRSIDPVEDNRRALTCRKHELHQVQAAIDELESNGFLHPVSVLRTERDRLNREIRTIENHLEQRDP